VQLSDVTILAPVALWSRPGFSGKLDDPVFNCGKMPAFKANRVSSPLPDLVVFVVPH